MTAHVNQSRSAGDYEWHYEYYDDEEPVSFVGLKANRYSIVIGFWVGLAVFVIFMFFVLTLLTKTGAPHLEIPDFGEKHHASGDSVLESGCPQAFPLPSLLDESRSLFHFYIHEEEKTKADPDDSTRLHLQDTKEGEKGNGDDHFLSNINIPNFIQSEHSSSLDNDDSQSPVPSV